MRVSFLSTILLPATDPSSYRTLCFCGKLCYRFSWPRALSVDCAPRIVGGRVSLLAQVEAGAAAVVKRRAEAALPYGFWTNTPVLKQTHTTAVAGAAAGRGTADYAHLIEALKTDALGKEQGADGK